MHKVVAHAVVVRLVPVCEWGGRPKGGYDPFSVKYFSLQYIYNGFTTSRRIASHRAM